MKDRQRVAHGYDDIVYSEQQHQHHLKAAHFNFLGIHRERSLAVNP